MKYRLIAASIALSVATAITALAQSTPRTSPGHIVITTRLVALFSDLEGQWLTAVRKKDAAALDHLLSDEFQVWSPAPPGAPIPREDWQMEAFASPPSSFDMRQMAVRTVADNVAIASFVLEERLSRNGKEVSERHFIVDVWTKAADNWLCTDRYLAEAPSATQPDIKPTGKQ